MGSGKEWREITEKWREKLNDRVDLVCRWTVLLCESQWKEGACVCVCYWVECKDTEKRSERGRKSGNGAV